MQLGHTSILGVLRRGVCRVTSQSNMVESGSTKDHGIGSLRLKAKWVCFQSLAIFVVVVVTLDTEIIVGQPESIWRSRLRNMPIHELLLYVNEAEGKLWSGRRSRLW